MRLMSDEISTKFNDLVESNKFLEVSPNEARVDASEVTEQVKSLTATVELQHLTIEQQKKKIVGLEAYSKFYNLKLNNIPEVPNENTDILLQRLHDIMHMMDLEPVRIYIDIIHRLPSNGRGPRHVIVTFVSKLDRDLVWSRKAMLSRTGSTIYIREHFDEATET